MTNKFLCSAFLAVFFMQFQANLEAQPFDTLLYDFTNIDDINPLSDGTFILIGDKRGSVKISRINSKAETIWTRTLTDSLFYRIREYEVHAVEKDSSMHR